MLKAMCPLVGSSWCIPKKSCSPGNSWRWLRSDLGNGTEEHCSDWKLHVGSGYHTCAHTHTLTQHQEWFDLPTSLPFQPGDVTFLLSGWGLFFHGAVRVDGREEEALEWVIGSWKVMPWAGSTQWNFPPGNPLGQEQIWMLHPWPPRP
jgi:hypothetical protein